MKSFEQSKQKSGAEQVREIIVNARKNIEREFSSGAGNSWVACYRTVLTCVNNWLYLAKDEGEIGPEEYERGHKKVMELAKIATDLHNQYPKADDIPPEDVQEKLISQLDDILR